MVLSIIIINNLYILKVNRFKSAVMPKLSDYCNLCFYVRFTFPKIMLLALVTKNEMEFIVLTFFHCFDLIFFLFI